MSEQAYFFDTYAFFEIIRGNPAYGKYRDASAITTIFNLAELNYGLKKEAGNEKADRITDKYFPLLVEVSAKDLKEAMSLKIKNKKLSIPDAIGYTTAKSYGVRFLTGDQEFKKMANVEFVKK
ncbi:MAG: PIN domain-containing protein [Candidatus Diapherotrites archaeon]|uniref:PIN domain-containing protein n=1 Tax=Candidatus Iainarchaeum sp. TaxID=3101447 RepID=A0A939C4H7_9ARCH|nr:PIN domain-containing protein [Candidatus Diapherotrites archaeon]